MMQKVQGLIFAMWCLVFIVISFFPLRYFFYGARVYFSITYTGFVGNVLVGWGSGFLIVVVRLG